ncbi:MAG: DNA gyrase inhibitor YacG [Pseudomonadota bacterium]|nr:DNA gyrase inhibitor YacG [Pseudomonadota bacterium]
MPARAKKCPYCGNPPAERFAPFCSAGCKDRDLLKWLGGGYRIPGRPAEPEELGEPEGE